MNKSLPWGSFANPKWIFYRRSTSLDIDSSASWKPAVFCFCLTCLRCTNRTRSLTQKNHYHLLLNVEINLTIKISNVKQFTNTCERVSCDPSRFVRANFGTVCWATVQSWKRRTCRLCPSYLCVPRSAVNFTLIINFLYFRPERTHLELCESYGRQWYAEHQEVDHRVQWLDFIDKTNWKNKKKSLLH